tara:strand:- start:1829 stop:2317 length:489 start_codon:yes stop_codon:yes gene_type:complete
MKPQKKRVKIRSIFHDYISVVKKGDTLYRMSPRGVFDDGMPNFTDWEILIDDMYANGNNETFYVKKYTHGPTPVKQILDNNIIVDRDLDDFKYITIPSTNRIEACKLRLLTLMKGLDFMVNIIIDPNEYKSNIGSTPYIKTDLETIKKELQDPGNYFKLKDD